MKEGAACRAMVSPTPCEEGTRPRIGTSTCEPIAKLVCPDGFAQDGLGCREVVPATRCVGATREALGTDACVSLGGNCTIATAGATYFVDSTVGPNHFKTIAEAINAAPASAIIDIAPGIYKESLGPITKSVVLSGRCASNVILDGDKQSGRLAMSVDTASADVTLQRITVRSFDGAVRVGGGSRLLVRETLFEDNLGAAATATGTATRLTLERSVVRGTRAESTGNAVAASSGAALIIRESSLLGNADKTVVVSAGATLAVDRTLVGDTILDPTGAFGSGIVILDGGRANITSSAIVGTHGEGIYSAGELTLKNSVVRHTVSSGVDAPGRGVSLWRGTSVITDVTLDDHADVGVKLSEKATLRAERLVIRNTGSTEENTIGAGILVVGGSSASVERSVVLRSKEAGIQATGANSVLEVKDSFIAGGRGRGDGTAGDGVFASKGGSVIVSDSVVFDNAEAGLSAKDTDSSVTATRSIVVGTRSNGDGKGGFGARAADGARMVLKRSALLRNRDIGVLVTAPKTSATLEEVEVFGTTAAASGTPRGRGLEINKGANADVRRSSFIENTQTTLEVSSPGSTLTLEDSVVARTKPNPTPSGGRALTIQRGARARVVGSVFAEQPDVGIAVNSADSTLEFIDSVIATTRASKPGFGYGVLGYRASLLLDHSRIESSHGAAMAFRESRAAVVSCMIRDNTIGITVDVNSALVETPRPSLPESASTVFVSTDTQFIDNVTRVGSGAVAIPRVLE